MASSLLSREGLVDLQARAGNQATVQALRSGPAPVVQRVISLEQASSICKRLHDAMAGWGTDEEAVYGALSGRTKEDIDAIRDAYLAQYDHTLQSEIDDEFSGSELARVNKLLEGQASPAAGATADQQQAATAERAKVIATHLREAMEGWGTEEDEIFNALEGRTANELNTIAREYAALTGHSLEQDLIDELSGDDLKRALGLLGVAKAGVFTNKIDQAMTEGETTTVQGRFEWAITNDEMRIEAGVKFAPDDGVSPPYADWNAQIAKTWNNYALTEPGGQKININLYLRPDSGASRTIKVHKNADPTKFWEDRANAGEWYVKMTDDVAPHEFGHLIGLQDEYQRTHGDITQITGAAPAAGPTNASGKTPEQIATDVHTAITGDPRANRAANVTTCLKAVGLINADGVPQQGDFAQSVQTAYDKAYKPSLVDTMRDNLDKAGKWTIQTVFSYATRTAMGNPEGLSKGGVANEPHDHAVEPRHLAEMAILANGIWPGKTWTVAPR
jgi:hypothetical protein